MMHSICALGLCGCVAGIAATSTQDGAPVDTFGAIVEPRLGTVVVGDTATTTLTIAGVHTRADYEIAIQVPARPEDLGTWVTIATTRTAHEPSSTDASTYEWQVAIAPAGLDRARWPQGGLLRIRAVGGDGEQLAGFYQDSDACLSGSSTWRARVADCGAVFSTGVIVASPGDPIDVAARPRFLDRRGSIADSETATYYQTIGAPATLADFRSKLGFGGDDVTSTYYNAGDLGIGREMHCRSQPAGGLACYVANYGVFGGDPDLALDRAVTRTDSFAAVAMVYTPPADAPNSVQFMVYGAAGGLVTRAVLDRFGDNASIPNNCLNCHGSAASYDASTHEVTQARFLMFDPAAFRFSHRDGFTLDAERTNLAQLDQLVRDANPTGAMVELLDGAPVPAAWNTSARDRELYTNVVAYACRSCHVARTDALAFASPDDVRRYADAIRQDVCVTHAMPNAEVPLARLWSGPARAYLASYLEIPGACAP